MAAVEGRARGQGWGEVQGATGPDQARPGRLQKDTGLYSKESHIILTLGLCAVLRWVWGTGRGERHPDPGFLVKGLFAGLDETQM